MMNLFVNKRGTISVFLSLILLPVMVVGCLTTDAARIYVSKAVISDAGEMAMNAALAQYDAELLDQFGLLAMEEDPSTLESSLVSYFNKSLNGSGLEANSYEDIMGLLTEQFNVLHVSNSEIYRTEVEKRKQNKK